MSKALGMMECRSFPAVMEAADAMVKSGQVELVSYEKTGAGLVTVIIRGELVAVQAAIESGLRSAEKVGEVVALHVINIPHPAVEELFFSGSASTWPLTSETFEG